MKKRKIMMSALSAALVGVVAIGGTLAFLSDQSNQVTNTFNVGAGYVEDPDDHLGLWLDEVKWENNEATSERTEIGNEYGELLPGSIVEKDPTFHLTTGSTDSYVFAHVSGVDAMIADGYYFTVEEPETLVDPANAFNTENWKKVDDTDGFDGLYIYFDGVDNIVEGGELDENGEEVTPADTMAPLFNWVKLGSAVENADFATIADGSVVVKGVAVQSANLTAAEAQKEAEKVLGINQD